ncbi:MAG: lysophospholipase [Treponema sp.]|nr:lysophospholipase [Treponema sp.]
MNSELCSHVGMDDGTLLHLRRWKTGENPRAVLHIVHGMGEHSQRYARLARRLNEEGIEVWAADQRGHGETALNTQNNPRRGGQLGHCANGDGFARVCADVHALNQIISKEHPELPLFLMGHSWGSFIVQSYIETYDTHPSLHGTNPLSGCVLSGTRGPDGIKVSLGAPLITCLAFLIGQRRGSSLIRALVDGAYHKPFKPNRTGFDWLSRDEAEVDAYIADPLCGFLCSSGFYRDMARALTQIHLGPAMERIRKDLPIYIMAGTADPVGDMGEGPAALSVAYRRLEIKNLETVLYPDARHEPLNETNREEVQESLLSWILRQCSA